MSFLQVILSIFTIINLIAFVLVANDKRDSKQAGNPDRLPEGLIFFMATIGGGVGVYLAMLLFRHKTRKWYFRLGVPLLILQNLAILYLIKDTLF